MRPRMHLNMRRIYPERSRGVPLDPSTRPSALLRIVVSDRRESNHDALRLSLDVARDPSSRDPELVEGLGVNGTHSNVKMQCGFPLGVRPSFTVRRPQHTPAFFCGRWTLDRGGDISVWRRGRRPRGARRPSGPPMFAGRWSPTHGCSVRSASVRFPRRPSSHR